MLSFDHAFEKNLLEASLSLGRFIPRVESDTVLAGNLKRSLRFSNASCTDLWIAAEDGLGGIFASCDVEQVLRRVQDECWITKQAKLHVFENSDFIHPDSPATSEGGARTIILHLSRLTAQASLAISSIEQAMKNTQPLYRFLIRFEALHVANASLGGFSVSLDVKNTEYVAIDRELKQQQQQQEEDEGDTNEISEHGIYFSRLMKRFPDQDQKFKINQLHNKLNADAFKLKVWEMGDLSVQATLDALESGDPLERIANVTQNFPFHIKRLSKIPVPVVFRELIEKLPASRGSFLWLNGELINLHNEVDASAILDQIQSSAKSMKMIREAGIESHAQLEKLLEARSTKKQQSWGVRVDVRKWAKGSVVFLNDLEKDEMYKQFPKSLSGLKQKQANMMMQGQLIPVRRNLYTAIFALDIANPAHLETLSTLRYFVRAGAPIRFGIVFSTSKLIASMKHVKDLTNDNDMRDSQSCENDCLSARCMIRLFSATRLEYGIDVALDMLLGVAQYTQIGQHEAQASCSEFNDLYAGIMQEATNAWSSGKFVTFANSVWVKPSADDALSTAFRMARYLYALKIKLSSFSLNGAIYALQGRIDRLLTGYLFAEQNLLKKADLVDEEDIFSQILRLSGGAALSNSQLINVPDSKLRFLHLPKSAIAKWNLPHLPAREVHGEDDSSLIATLWVPFSNMKMSCTIALTALEFYLNHDKKVRLGLFPVHPRASRAHWAKIYQFIKQKDFLSLEQVLFSCPKSLFTEDEDDHDSSSYAEMPPSQEMHSSLRNPNVLLVCNGRVIELPSATASGDENVDDDDDENMLDLTDIKVLVQAERSRFPLTQQQVGGDNLDYRMCMASALGSVFVRRVESASKVSNGVTLPELSEANEFLSWSSSKLNENDSGALTVFALIDPLHANTAQVISILQWLRTDFQAQVTVLFNPELDVAKVPQQASFHRWTAGGKDISFSSLDGVPQNQLLTLKLHVPTSWIAYPSDMGVRDPDNLMLGDGSLLAEYEVTHVLVDGHASYANQEPCAGVQMELLEYDGLIRLHENDSPRGEDMGVVADSIVMFNLGYWQMKAKPGAYFLRLIGNYILSDPKQSIAQYNAFNGPGALELKVTKMNKDGDIPSKKKSEEGEDDDVMHVFSLASGALYERFLRIMMLSVRKRSSGRIKFWILENYISHKMKQFLPGFAAKNNFTYELVTYKWPEWLRGQEERQRQIWGMKILFLDVLFPLSVKRIIYVDSDQVLRSDLRELWTLDLQGAPYGMTPFCTSRKETLGFQFWREGYWAGHLRGKNYHISALFVVDLVKFREQAVGDRLRATYQQLSADPNSLSNLDQDLPNYAQHEIPIFSLPQEWLWCESWCSDASKAYAKTIDLCNNPLHKEPKLEMAKRVIRGELFPESWEELDVMVGFS